MGFIKYMMSYLCTSPARIGKALYQMLVIQTFRADRLLAIASLFVATVMGEVFMHHAEQELDLGMIVTNEVRGWVVRVIVFLLFVGPMTLCCSSWRVCVYIESCDQCSLVQAHVTTTVWCTQSFDHRSLVYIVM